MLSLDLFNSRYEKKLHEGAIDDTIAHLIEPLSRRAMDIRTKLRTGRLDPKQVVQLEKEYEELVQKRLDIILDRKTQTQEQQVPSKQDPFAYVKPEPKGIGDIQDPRDKMAQLQQRAKKGALANVGAGIKAFIKGEPEPMGEQQELGRRGIGMANMKALQATVEKGFARTIFQFPTGKYVVGEDDTDKMADYYNALDSAGRTNFVYNVLGDGAKFIQMSRELSIQAAPVEPQQPELPGMPQASPQRELPLSEKKKSKDDDIEAGDIKVARELQKLRAQYPAANSDIEAVASAEIDSTERSQRQLAAIRGANEKQDALLKQLVALDQEQGREINTLDKENDSLEKQLDQVQRTNAALAQTVSQMTGTKKSARPTPQPTTSQPADSVINLIPGAPADQQKVEPRRKPTAQPVATTDTGKQDTEPAPKLSTNRGPISQVAKFTPPEKLVKAQKTAESKIKEHGGGIGPKKHWQDLMQEGQPQELINRYLAIDAENDVEAVRAAIQAISKDPALSVTSKSRLLGQIGMIIRRHRLPLGRAYYQFMRQYMEDINETALNPQDPQGDYEAKRRALHDLSLNKDVDQQAVLQRRLDLDREAKAKGLAETVTNVKAGMAEIYRRLAPKIERHRDSFLAGQLYDELENYAELHGAEGEFKRMMSTARNRAHMEYDTNPGGFHNWFWFLPYEDQDVTEMDKSQPSQERHGHRPLGAKGTAAKPVAARKVVKDLAMDLDQAFAKQKPVKKKGVAEGLIYSGDTWQDVLYRINVLNDIFGDQKDLAASFEPASQPEWGPFRDRILRSRTVLDTYAKVKQLANMNVPLTDVEIEMLADVAWDGGGGPVEPAGHWGERDYDWLEDLYAQQFAVVQHLLDQKAQGHGQNKTKSGQTVHEQGVAESNDDIKKRMSKLEALALAANRAGDDTKCKMYQQKIQSLKQKLSQSMNEFDASGYDRYSIYMDDYDLKEKFSDLDDAVDAIEAYKRDDPKSRYADYNVRDLDGKVVWRNDAWQDIQKPGKIQFLPRNDQGVAEGLSQNQGQVRQTLNAWMNQDQQYEDPTQRAGFQAKVWPYIQKNIQSILSDKGADGKGSYPAAPYAAWLLVQHMDAYPQNQAAFLSALEQSGLNPTDGDGKNIGKLQFLRDRYNVNKWIAANANNKEYYVNGKPLPNPTVNVRNPAIFKDAGQVATSRDDALKNAIAAGNKLLVAAVQATNAQTQPSFKQGVAEGSKPGEYHVHTVYFKDGTKKRIRVTSDEFDVVGYYKQRGQAVDRVDYDYQIHSDMTEDFGMPGTTIPRKSVIQGYTVFFNPKTQVVSVTRGGDSEEAAIEQARVGTPSMKNFRQAADRLIDRIESDLNEAKEIQTREDFIKERDRLLRMISIETTPANKQILKSAIRQLENQAENEGWITIQSRMVREDSDGGEAVEMAIMRRMLIAHTDLIVEFGLDKVVDAIEEVAYNVGDTDEIGSSDVSGWVRQVKQILGADA